MEDKEKTEIDNSDSLENLEGVSTSVSEQKDEGPKFKEKSSLTQKFGKLTSRLNIYLLAFILLIIVAVIILFIVYTSSSNQQDATINTQELTQETLDQITGSDTKIGDPKQLLTVESDAVFNGKVLIRDGLDIAGPLKVGGSLSLPGITVSGTSAFDDVTINTLSIAGDANIQGQLSVQKGLTVSGPVTFSGTFSAAAFSIRTLQVDGDVTLGRHIDAAGPTPGLSTGAATGSGGTATISGTDTAGTVTINVGSGASAGVLATINFANAFSGTPHVIITPVAAQGSPTITGTQKFYLSTRTSSSFSIAVSGGLSSGSISFDYVVID